MGVRSPATRPTKSTPLQEVDGTHFVSHYRTRPGRYVFIEENNPDGWIATDLMVDTPQ